MQIDQSVVLQAGLVFTVGLLSGLALARIRVAKSFQAQRLLSRQERLSVQNQWKALLIQQGRDMAAFNEVLRSDLAVLTQELVSAGLSVQSQDLIRQRMLQIEGAVDLLDEHLDDWSEQLQQQSNRPELLPSLGDKLQMAFHP